jgi:hypothetical protein
VDRLVNALHWLDMFVPGASKKTDWREVGQIRHRLDNTKIENSKIVKSDKLVDATLVIPTPEPAKAVSSTEIQATADSRLSSIRAHSGGSKDKAALSRWYKKSSSAAKEQALTLRLEQGRRSHEARQITAAFSGIKDVQEIYDVQNQPVNQRDQERLLGFLAGTTDDINDFIAASQSARPSAGSLSDSQDKENGQKVTEVNIESPLGLAAKFPFLSRSDNFVERAKNNRSTDLETIAILNDIVKIDPLNSSENGLKARGKATASTSPF